MWTLSNRFDPRALPLADAHYNRRKIGSPQFVPPGRCVVLLTPWADALWVTSWPFAQYVRHAWGGAWVNSLFRNESVSLSSELIRAAVAATLAIWPTPPRLGLITFVDRAKTRPKKDPGYCYLRAGFEPARCPIHASRQGDCPACAGRTKGGLFALQLRPEAMPAPEPAGCWLGPLFGQEMARATPTP